SDAVPPARSPCQRGSRGGGEENVSSEQRKLVVFVPREALDAVRDALFEAGAGRIGEYSRCSWYTQRTATFLGGAGSSPAAAERRSASRRTRSRSTAGSSQGSRRRSNWASRSSRWCRTPSCS